MAKQQNQPRRPNQPAQPNPQNPAPNPVRRQAPAPARASKTASAPRFDLGSNELIFGRENFKWMGIGLALIVLGLILMAGGAQPDPNQWDESLIYSPRRITLAPILMVAGFLVQIYAIFKGGPTGSNEVAATAETEQA